MRLELETAELDYAYRLLLSRPMGEVEPLVIKIRQQVAEQAPQPTPPAYAPAVDDAPAYGPLGALNGHGQGVDSLPLP